MGDNLTKGNKGRKEKVIQSQGGVTVLGWTLSKSKSGSQGAGQSAVTGKKKRGGFFVGVNRKT